MTAHVAVNARQCQLSVRERSSAAKKHKCLTKGERIAHLERKILRSEEST